MELTEEMRSYLPSQSDFDKLVEAARSHLEVLMEKPQRSIMPEIVCLCRHWPDREESLRIYAIATDFNEPDEKAVVMREIGRNLFTEHLVPTVVSLTAEAWLSMQKYCLNQPSMQPRHDPLRQEVLLVSALGLGHTLRGLTTRPVRRDDKGRMVWSGLWHPLQSEGVQTNILEQIFVGMWHRLSPTHN